MKRLVVGSLAVVIVASVTAGAALLSGKWNAALKAQDSVVAFSQQGRHADAAAEGHRYFAGRQGGVLTLDECMFLTTIANEERLANARSEGVQTLDAFDQNCRSKYDGKYAYYITYADGLRRVMAGESSAVLDSVWMRANPKRDTSIFAQVARGR
jgi:hypothetical protein